MKQFGLGQTEGFDHKFNKNYDSLKKNKVVIQYSDGIKTKKFVPHSFVLVFSCCTFLQLKTVTQVHSKSYKIHTAKVLFDFALLHHYGCNTVSSFC